MMDYSGTEPPELVPQNRLLNRSTISLTLVYGSTGLGSTILMRSNEFLAGCALLRNKI
jgi:hypothetical protein